MKWLERLFGTQEEPVNVKKRVRKTVAKKAQKNAFDEQIRSDIKNYVLAKRSPWSVRQISEELKCGAQIVYGVIGTLSLKKEVVLHHTETGEIGRPTKFFLARHIEPVTPKTIAVERWGRGELDKAVTEAVKTFNGPFEVSHVGRAIGHRDLTGGGVYHALKRLAGKGIVRERSRRGEGCSCGTWELTRKAQPKPETTPPKPIPAPTRTSNPVTVPFYYDAEFRVVAKRDKRIIALIEQKKKDAMGQEKWEPAETDIRLYQQALKAVCGHMLAPNGVM